MNQSLIITTAIKKNQQLEDSAREISMELRIPFFKRDKLSLKAILEQTAADAILLLRQGKLSLVMDGQELFFHPGLAKLRIKEIQAGKTDQMIKAMDLQSGDSVLDCTLGLASDAIVASYVAGQPGSVIGIEDSLPIAEIVRRGLQSYSGEKPELLSAMRRIQVIHSEHFSYLKELPDNSFDVVYFDPMFRVPRESSSNMAPLRPFANKSPLSIEVLKEAQRVARKRVVMKENRHSGEFKRLKFEEIQGGRYSPIAYGIIEKVKGCHND